jgi:hypothetical protein
MKNLLTLALALIFAGTVSAQRGAGSLHVRTVDRYPVAVFLDGRPMGAPGRDVLVSGVVPGYHTLKIVEMRNFRYGYPRQRVLYNVSIDVRPATELCADIDYYATVALTERPLYADNYDHCTQGNPYQSIPRPACQTGTAQYTDPYANNWSNNSYAPRPMCESEFRQLRGTVLNTSFESTRLEIIKGVARNNYFTTAQVSDLMSLFSFESYKMDVAKALYDHTVDRQNYYTLSNGFTFNSYIDELNQFLAYR